MDISSPHLISVTLLRRPATSIFNNVLNTLFIMFEPAKISDILYGIANSRDQELDLFQRELKAYILRRGILHARESESPRVTEPP